MNYILHMYVISWQYIIMILWSGNWYFGAWTFRYSVHLFHVYYCWMLHYLHAFSCHDSSSVYGMKLRKCEIYNNVFSNCRPLLSTILTMYLICERCLQNGYQASPAPKRVTDPSKPGATNRSPALTDTRTMRSIMQCD